MYSSNDLKFCMSERIKAQQYLILSNIIIDPDKRGIPNWGLKKEVNKTVLALGLRQINMF